MQTQSTQKVFEVTVAFKDGSTRTVTVKASSREVAEQRAIKRTSAAGVHRG